MPLLNEVKSKRTLDHDDQLVGAVGDGVAFIQPYLLHRLAQLLAGLRVERAEGQPPHQPRHRGRSVLELRRRGVGLAAERRR